MNTKPGSWNAKRTGSSQRDVRHGVRLASSLLLVMGLVVSLLAVAQRPAAAAGESIIAGELRITPTLDNIGVVWFIDGDTNLDSSMAIEFRVAGESSWRPGAPAMRAEPTVIVDGSPLGINSWAASAMFLERGTAYEVRATISDPDGGGTTQIAQATTRTLLQSGSTLRYVVPGSGSGSGTQSDPFQGLQAAADSASPGDAFVAASGVYSPFVLSTSGTAGAPISFTSADGADVIVDGAGTGRGVVTLESTTHVILSGLTIRNGGWGIDAQNTQELVITNNTITDVDFGIYNRRDADLERYQVVCDNVIEGRTAWPGAGIPGERGIDLRGWGNTICNNTVSDFGDCISMQPMTGPSFGNDIFGNDANRCVDDGIEVDFNQANVRVYRNRVTNARMGVSVQPIYGGPAYIFRNELFNLESSTIKLNNGPSGLFVAHNSGVKHDNALQDGGVFNNTVLRNNLFIGTRYAFEFTFEATQGRRDFDYNAWGSLRAGNWFKWDNIRYARTGDLPDGVEDNGIDVDLGAVVSASLPASWDSESPAGSQDLRPSTGSVLVDRGAVIPNINGPFVADGAPDSGAFEAGGAAPGYGPGTPLITPPNGPVPPLPTAVPPTPTAGSVLCNGLAATIDMNSNGGDGTGTPGADVILGTAGDDVIDGLSGNDTICAGDGDDIVVGGDGDDTLLGGLGRDIVRGNAGRDVLDGGDGNDRLLGGIGADTIEGGEGDDYIGGFGGADAIRGGPGSETIFGGFGADTIDGDGGADTIFGLVGDDTINGGDGPDILHGDRGNDTINGGNGNDVIHGGNASDVLNGNGGDDSVNGGRADDILSGGGGTNDACAGNKHNLGDTADSTCELTFGVP